VSGHAASTSASALTSPSDAYPIVRQPRSLSPRDLWLLGGAVVVADAFVAVIYVLVSREGHPDAKSLLLAATTGLVVIAACTWLHAWQATRNATAHRELAAQQRAYARRMEERLALAIAERSEVEAELATLPRRLTVLVEQVIAVQAAQVEPLRQEVAALRQKVTEANTVEAIIARARGDAEVVPMWTESRPHPG
jgi:hypothetical protein